MASFDENELALLLSGKDDYNERAMEAITKNFKPVKPIDTKQKHISQKCLFRSMVSKHEDGRPKRPRVGGAMPPATVVASSPPPIVPAPPSPPPVPSSTDTEFLLPAADSEEDEEEDVSAVAAPSSPPRGHPGSPVALQQPSCFFALLRDLFNETAEQKMSAAKLEERVKAWSHSTGAQQVEWFARRESWPDMVSSALRFLAGDYIDFIISAFYIVAT
ncbi:hypothetical protein HPB50_020815 [Hyalomma asiaticum]|uniref:Uncharacterized protein n=1 Tax=Hyalomma asiaticum TaxID=266040 RepID=A0ACB7S838_HYAAI|nr:hypothetical protein HPB50_020815 [Hyalomma asiaticum]